MSGTLYARLWSVVISCLIDLLLNLLDWSVILIIRLVYEHSYDAVYGNNGKYSTTY